MVINLGVSGSFNRFTNQSESAKFSSVFGVQREVIDPFVEVCAGSELHFSGHPVRKWVMLNERENEFSQQSLGFIRQRPVELVEFRRICLRVHILNAECGLRNFG